MKIDETFMSFLLQHQERHNRTLNFVILMESITTAAQYINYHYQMAAVQKNLGQAGATNVQDEEVMKLDEMAQKIVVHYLKESSQVIEAVSEEEEDPIPLNDDGRYMVYFDPLDGSSNVQHSLPIGFVFGVVKRNLEGEEDRHLRKGDEYIAAGMFLIPAGIFTFALKDCGTWRFLLDGTGGYVRPERVYFPEKRKSWELSYNSANVHTFQEPVQKWLTEQSKNYAFRYAGSLAVDFHRLLNNGGMFCYPAIVNHPNPKKNRKDGKLRLLYECNPVAFMAREAGGVAVNEEGQDILDVEPRGCHQRSSIYVGSKEVVEDIRKALVA